MFQKKQKLDETLKAQKVDYEVEMSFDTESSDADCKSDEYNFDPSSGPTRYSYSSHVHIDPTDDMPER